jgi:outer membrane protein OmpA-like peptidoglycan-associated protein
MDAPVRSSKSTTSGDAPRTTGDDFDDVTVRKFSETLVATPGSSSGARDLNTIFFEQNSAAIAEQYRVSMQQIADALARDPQSSAILEGHTDDTGGEAYNLDLSSRRAVAVRQALISEFNVPSTQVTAIGSGSAAPVQSNSSPTGRAYNRRVAVRFVHLSE